MNFNKDCLDTKGVLYVKFEISGLRRDESASYCLTDAVTDIRILKIQDGRRAFPVIATFKLHNAPITRYKDAMNALSTLLTRLTKIVKKIQEYAANATERCISSVMISNIDVVS